MRMMLLVPLVLAAAGPEPRQPFFGKSVDFFNTAKPAPPANLWDGEKAPEGPAKDLLENPTPENAKRYLEWQQERLARLQKALEALEAAKAAEAPKEVLYFTRPDCPFCREQDKVIEGLAVRKILPGESPELWKRYEVTATPTLVIRGKALRGFTTRETIDKEMKP